MGDRLDIGEPVARPRARLLPVTHGLFGCSRLGEMVGQDFWLLIRKFSEPFLQHTSDPAMELLALGFE